MQKTVKLKDETEVLIRELTAEDLERSLAFFQSLPEEDRAYLRRDVVQREVVERRIRELRSGDVMRLVGATDNFIKVPFYIQGLIQGALGGIGGLSVLFVAFMFISSNFGQGITSGLSRIRFLSPFLSVGIIFCSMFIGWLGCFLSLKQFLKS